MEELILILTDSPQLLFSISVAQAGYLQTLESLKLRNIFYTEKLLPEITRRGLRGRKMKLNEYERELNPEVFKDGIAANDLVMKNIIESNSDLSKMFTQLHDSAKLKYPECRFIDMSTG